MSTSVNRLLKVGAFGLWFSVAAHAETWVHVYTGANGTVFYADVDSVSRTGDLSTIVVRGKAQHEVRFDLCKGNG